MTKRNNYVFTPKTKEEIRESIKEDSLVHKDGILQIVSTAGIMPIDDYVEFVYKKDVEMCKFLNTPAEELYKDYPDKYSKEPTYRCDSQCHSGYKVGVCQHGDGTYCYWKENGCTSQMCLDNPSKMAMGGLLKEIFEEIGVDTSKAGYL